METGTAAGAGPGPANGADTSAGSGTDVSTGSAPAALSALSALSAWSASSALSAQSGGGAAIALHGATRRLGPFTLGPLDMEIPTGMVTGFIGPDGAGKTTAIKAMLGMLPLDSGTVTALGTDPLRRTADRTDRSLSDGPRSGRGSVPRRQGGPD